MTVMSVSLRLAQLLPSEGRDILVVGPYRYRIVGWHPTNRSVLLKPLEAVNPRRDP